MAQQVLESSTVNGRSMNSKTKPLYNHEISSSNDPGSTICNQSCFSLASLNHPNIMEPLLSQRGIPTIRIDEVQADQGRVNDEEMAASEDTPHFDWQQLKIPVLKRSTSNASSASSSTSEYFSAPNSPVHKIRPRSLSLDSLGPSFFSTSHSQTFEFPSSTLATHLERKTKYASVSFGQQRSPVEVNLRINPKTFSTYSDHNEAFTATSLSSPNTLDGSSCDLTVNISVGLHFDPFNKNSPSQTTAENIGNDRSENEMIEQIIRRNLVTFSKLTNLDTLYPHLISTSILSMNEYEQLEGIKSTNGKMNFLYLFLLPKKGETAYTMFFKCLKDEDNHSGHGCLVNLINTELYQ